MTPLLFPDKPNPETLNFPMQCGDNQQLDARAWRHPFTINATGASPLKAWTQAFTAQVTARVNANPTLPRPSTWRFYLDTEPKNFMDMSGENGVVIPNHLASQHTGPNCAGCIWHTWKVPGSPGWVPPANVQGYATTSGMTLQQLFAAEAARYGWDVNNPQSAFDETQRGDDPDNRPAMIWWANIWARASDAVLANVCYSVLKSEFGSTVCYGNWDMSSVDGEEDTTGWYVDWNQTQPQPPPGPMYTNGMVVSDSLKRCVIEFSPAMHGPPLTRHPTNNANYDLWAGVEQVSSGTADCPIFYPMSCTHHTGLWGCTPEGGGQYIGLVGHQQHDLWTTNANDLETISQSTIRLNRHTAESIINSYGGGRQTRLVPWVPQFVADMEQLPGDPISYYSEEAPQRALFAMLRGKNVGELLQWSAAGTVPAQEAAWIHTMDLMKRIYAYAVTKLTPLGGMVPSTSPDLEPAMLEFTLRDVATDKPYTADVVPGTWNVNGTMLKVEVSGLNTPIPAPEFLCSANGCWVIRHELNLEGTVKHASAATVCSVDLWHPPFDPEEDGQWESFSSLQFGISTPDGAFRKTFALPNLTGYIDQDGKLLLRIRVIGGSNTIRVEHDLVQVIPFWTCVSCSSETEGEAEGLALADVDVDGEVGIGDIELLLNAAAMDDAIADVNQDGEFNGADVTAFEASYLGSTP